MEKVGKYMLVQFSSPSCGPCRMATNYIKKTFSDEDIGYELVDVGDVMRNPDSKWYKVLAAVKIRSVPTFVVAKEYSDKEGIKIELVDGWAGLSTQRINKYVNDYYTPNADVVE